MPEEADADVAVLAEEFVIVDAAGAAIDADGNEDGGNAAADV